MIPFGVTNANRALGQSQCAHQKGVLMKRIRDVCLVLAIAMVMIGMAATTWAANQPAIGPCEGTTLNLNTTNTTDTDIGPLAAVDNTLVVITKTAMTPLNVGIGLVPRDHGIAEHAIYYYLNNKLMKTMVVKRSANGNMPNVGFGASTPNNSQLI